MQRERKADQLLSSQQQYPLVWVPFKDDYYSGRELKYVMPDGTFEEPNGISLRMDYEKLPPKNGGSKKPTPEIQPTRTLIEVISLNKKKWEEKLGRSNLQFHPVPESLTPEVLRHSHRYEYTAVDFPDLREYINKEKFDSMQVPEFLDYVENLLPGFHHYESLTNDQKNDLSIWRNLNEWFWENVKRGKIDFPDCSGGWYLIETTKKLSQPSKITGKLRFEELESLFDDYSLSDINSAINRGELEILDALKLKKDQGKVIILDAVKLNLVYNLLGFNDHYEWTSTVYRHNNGPPDHSCIYIASIVIGEQYGNRRAESASWAYPINRNNTINYCLGIKLN
jgi:hypothetical protein